MTPSLVDVIVPNWNGERHLEKCLGSLGSQTYPRVHPIVGDNGSSHGSVALVGRRFPQATGIEVGVFDLPGVADSRLLEAILEASRPNAPDLVVSKRTLAGDRVRDAHKLDNYLGMGDTIGPEDLETIGMTDPTSNATWHNKLKLWVAKGRDEGMSDDQIRQVYNYYAQSDELFYSAPFRTMDITQLVPPSWSTKTTTWEEVVSAGWGHKQQTVQHTGTFVDYAIFLWRKEEERVANEILGQQNR